MRSAFTFLGLLLASTLLAQNTFSCGMTKADTKILEKRLLRYKVQLKNGLVESRTETSFIPIVFYLIANDKGLGRVKESEVLDQLCQLNEDFISQNIQFFIKNLKYIDDGTLYENHYDGRDRLRQERDNGALNIFIVKDANNDSSLEDGTTLGYYDPQRDWLVIRKDQVNGDSIVLTHEIGHFFGLLHPYNGWDFEPWKEAVHGNPAPTRSPSGVATELMDGSNCERSGDFLCDTPPDYFFSFGSEDCNHTTNVLDPVGVQVDPDELNYMANFLNGCERNDYFFSGEQIEIMSMNVQDPDRSYLRNDFTPTDSGVPKIPILETPSNESTVATFNLVSFEWSEIEGATQYLFEIDRVRSFNVQPIRKVTEDPFLELSNLEAKRQYYWRVRSFNAYETCTEFSSPVSFRTGERLDTTQFQQIEQLKIFPNPTSAQNTLTVELATQRNFSATILIYDIVGRLVLEYETLISPAERFIELDINRLSTGIYIIKAITEEQEVVKQFVVAD
ncbi:MAG: zinc-dependent metalloprotease [Bacteroidota bacterium]